MDTVILTFINRVDGHLLSVSYNKKTGLMFSRMVHGIPSVTNINGIRLSKSGMLRENPDLKGKTYREIKEESIRRLYKKLHSYKTPEEIQEYIINDLKMQGYERKLVNTQFLKQYRGK